MSRDGMLNHQTIDRQSTVKSKIYEKLNSIHTVAKLAGRTHAKATATAFVSLHLNRASSWGICPEYVKKQLQRVQFPDASVAIGHTTTYWNTYRILDLVGWKLVQDIINAAILMSFHKIFLTIYPTDDYINIVEGKGNRLTRTNTHGKLGAGRQDLGQMTHTKTHNPKTNFNFPKS